MINRLIELLQDADKKCNDTKQCEDCIGFGKGNECINYHIADHLLSYGVIAPPCELNDLVYVIPCRENGLKEIAEMRCIGFAISRDQKNVNLVDWKNKLYQPCFSNFGIHIFSTRKEAENALAKMKGGAD